MYVYSAAWLSLAVVLTLIFGGLTWVAWRRRGAGALLTGLGWTLLPAGFYLTGTLRILGVITDQLLGYFSGFVFNPKTWAGIIVLALSVGLWSLGRLWSGRQSRGRSTDPTRSTGQSAGGAASLPRSPTPTPTPTPVVDEDLDDIDAILRRHGIN